VTIVEKQTNDLSFQNIDKIIIIHGVYYALFEALGSTLKTQKYYFSDARNRGRSKTVRK